MTSSRTATKIYIATRCRVKQHLEDTPREEMSMEIEDLIKRSSQRLDGGADYVFNTAEELPEIENTSRKMDASFKRRIEKRKQWVTGTGSNHGHATEEAHDERSDHDRDGQRDVDPHQCVQNQSNLVETYSLLKPDAYFAPGNRKVETTAHRGIVQMQRKLTEASQNIFVAFQ
jgi:hypothetical protein